MVVIAVLYTIVWWLMQASWRGYLSVKPGDIGVGNFRFSGRLRDDLADLSTAYHVPISIC